MILIRLKSMNMYEKKIFFLYKYNIFLFLYIQHSMICVRFDIKNKFIYIFLKLTSVL
jgi:hypothetical protein